MKATSILQSEIELGTRRSIVLPDFFISTCRRADNELFMMLPRAPPLAHSKGCVKIHAFEVERVRMVCSITVDNDEAGFKHNSNKVVIF